MDKFDIKIGEFASIILDDVNKQSVEMNALTTLELEKEFEETELVFLQRAYSLIQDGLRKINREKSEIISKNKMENRIKLLNKRNEIVEHVFKDAENALKVFAKSDEYKEFLLKTIEKNIAAVGVGEGIIVYLAHTDSMYADAVTKQFGVKVELESKTIKMFGGCKVYNPARNIFLDDSFARRLETEREGFLEKCNLAIE